jgi:hypothetical protein
MSHSQGRKENRNLTLRRHMYLQDPSLGGMHLLLRWTNELCRKDRDVDLIIISIAQEDKVWTAHLLCAGISHAVVAMRLDCGVQRPDPPMALAGPNPNRWDLHVPIRADRLLIRIILRLNACRTILKKEILREIWTFSCAVTASKGFGFFPRCLEGGRSADVRGFSGLGCVSECK